MEVQKQEDTTYDWVDREFREGRFYIVDALLLWMAVGLCPVNNNAIILWLTVTLPAKDKLPNRKWLCEEAKIRMNESAIKGLE